MARTRTKWCAVVLPVFSVLATTASHGTSKIQGLIAQNCDNMTLQISGSRDVTVVLTESTEVRQIQGVFQVRRKEMAALIPGLEVQVEGSYNDQNQVQVQTQKNQKELERQKADLRKQNAEWKEHKAAIDAAIARFGQLTRL